MSIKIPQQAQFSQANRSDLFGNLWYTKSVNLDEEGYLKLSNRAVSILSQDDDSNLGLPLSWGRNGTSSFLLATSTNPYKIVVDENTGINNSQDTDSGNPGLFINSRGKWWQNRWHVTTQTSVFSKTGTTWTDRAVALTTGKIHAFEVFRNKVSACITNGNTVILIDTSYGVTTTLTLPTDYEAIGLSYSNNKMAIITRLSSTASSQNQEAYFFVWDGASTAANQGFGIGSDVILAITPYKSSWVILTRTGELKYFNGGGFETLVQLPYDYYSLDLGDSVNLDLNGDVLQVEGDLIYLNMNNNLNSFGDNLEIYLENFPAGILCYDPNVGLYHRYAPSISKMKTAAVLTANVNTSTGTMTIALPNIPQTGNPVMQLSSNTVPVSPLKVGIIYYVIRVSPTQFKLASTKQNAMDGINITLATQGDTSNVFAFLDLVDYGQSQNPARTGGVALTSKRTKFADHLVFGGDYLDASTSDEKLTVNMTVNAFPNIGYAVTSKILSNEIEDNITKVFIKHRPLKTYDKIVLKYKNKDILGLPVTSPQNNTNLYCTWVNSTTFTTSINLALAKTYLEDTTNGTNEVECEIVNGAAAGQMSQIVSITLNSGVYTVVLSDQLDGAISGNISNILVNNWHLLGTIESTDLNGWKEFPMAKASKWVRFKLELRGSQTTIEEFQSINNTQLAAT